MDRKRRPYNISPPTSEKEGGGCRTYNLIRASSASDGKIQLFDYTEAFIGASLFFIVRRVVASRNVKSHEEPELDTHTKSGRSHTERWFRYTRVAYSRNYFSKKLSSSLWTPKIDCLNTFFGPFHLVAGVMIRYSFSLLSMTAINGRATKRVLNRPAHQISG